MSQDKQDIVKTLLAKIREIRDAELDAYGGHKQASVEAPGAMESHSDTTKFQEGVLADDAARRADALDRLIRTLEGAEGGTMTEIREGAIAEVEENGKITYFYIVPEGAAGERIETSEFSVQTISESCPLGRALFLKHAGETVEAQVPAGVKKLKVLAVY